MLGCSKWLLFRQVAPLRSIMLLIFFLAKAKHVLVVWVTYRINALNMTLAIIRTTVALGK